MRRTVLALAATMVSALKPGSAVPAFSVKNHLGETVTESTSKKYVLWMYPKADTGG